MLLSLFAGCGGLDLGHEQAGFDIGLAYDIRQSSVASWNRNRSGGQRGRVADLREIRLSDMDSDHGGKFVPSGVIGGPPCQSFSRANSSRSPDDPRGKLVRHFFSIALRCHRHRGPLDFILMENVPELAKARNSRLLQHELDRLITHGFDVRTFLVDAVKHSVPQRRKRLFVLAMPNTSRAIDRWKHPASGDDQKTVRDAIHGLPTPAFFARDLKRESISFHPNHWCMMPKSRRFSDGSLVEGDSSARSFKTLAWNEPSITASYGHREVHVHPNGNRRLSVFEAMRIQGFPDDYVLEGTLSAQIDQVGEAVPPPMAEAVAMSIKSALNTTTKDSAESVYERSGAKAASS